MNKGKKLRNGRYYSRTERFLPGTLFFLSFAILLGFDLVVNQHPDFFNKFIQVQAVDIQTTEESQQHEIQAGQTVEPTPVPIITPTPTPKPLTIEDKIKDVFGEHGELAVAIAMSESHLIPDRTLIAKAGHYSWSSPTYKGECSIGLFMINLAEDGCEGRSIHASKIPGKTLEDKIAWLKVPENNIRTAKKIFDSQGNFTAWSGYTGGGYKKFLEE